MKKTLALFLSLLLLFSFAACSKTESDDGGQDAQTELTSVEKIKQSGKLRMGTSADYPPFEYHMLVDGKDDIVGFDIELGKLIAEELGVELEITDMGFDALLMSLQSDKFDVVIAGMTYKPERYGLFSESYYTEGQAVLIRSEDADKFTKAEDLAGLTIGAQKGTVQADLAKTAAEGVTVLELVKFPDLVTELKNSKIDAIVVDYVVAEDYLSGNEDLMISSIELEDGLVYKGVVVQEGNTDLIDVINPIIEKGLADGSFAELMQEAKDNAQYEIPVA
ncbi:MAG: transporter substrate-binding domain-containing protein [Clostridia bacterium]|nr:transporter substrate-binding domain-containing protein [Clostridia bacterium]MBQ6000609.1 transporter substrate-binding domain-containing protein [Clostridia bacterium]